MFASSKTGWVGFDIGAASVKAAQIVRSDGGYRLRAAAIVPRRERWSAATLTDDQPRSSADEVAAAASLCDGLSGSSAAAVLPAAICDMVQMDAPAGKRSGVAPNLPGAVEAETHRSMQHRVFDASPIAFQAGKINVVTASRAWSDQVSSDVAQGGWSCRLIDALPWALARATTLAEPAGPARNVAVLDWGYGKATVCLVHLGAPALVRSLKDCAFQDVLQTVAKGLRVDEPVAEVLLQQYGLTSGAAGGSGSAAVISELLAEPLTRLAQEIRRTLGYWQGLARGQAPEMIYLFGGGGALAGVAERLTAMLGTAVDAWRLPAEANDGKELPPACLLGAAAGLSALAWEAA